MNNAHASRVGTDIWAQKKEPVTQLFLFRLSVQLIRSRVARLSGDPRRAPATVVPYDR